MLALRTKTTIDHTSSKKDQLQMGSKGKKKEIKLRQESNGTYKIKINSKNHNNNHQNRYHNSPIRTQNGHNYQESTPLNPLTFTELLNCNIQGQLTGDKQSKKKQKQRQISRGASNAMNFSNLSVTSRVQAPSIRRMMRDDSNLTPDRNQSKAGQTDSISQERDRKSSKSSVRLMNVNRLTATPKLTPKGQANTFKQALSDEMSGQNRPELRLECSEKISKFTASKSNYGHHGPSVHQKWKILQSKSGLQSTGCINLSNQRMGQSQAEILDTINQASRTNNFDLLTSTVFKETTISQCLIQLADLKRRTRQVENLHKEKLAIFQKKAFDFEENRHNPEYHEHSPSIELLQAFKESVDTEMTLLIQRLTLMKKQMLEELSQKIRMAQDEKKSETHQIDWLVLQSLLDQQNSTENGLLKAQLLIHRIQSVQEQYNKSNLSQNSISSQGQRQSIKKELEQLQAQLQKQQSQLAPKTTNIYHPAIACQQIDLACLRLNRLKQLLNRAQCIGAE